LNWIICENATHPAKKIKDVLLQNAEPAFEQFVRTGLGLIETQVLRTGMLAKDEVILKEPLALRMQDWWTLPLDKEAFIGTIPEVEGFVPKSNFSNELIRKLYTFNGTNGPVAYIGWANGYRILHESALAYPAIFKEIQEESAYGLIHEFGLDETEQREFMAVAMKKYTDPAINDLIERNAADSKRKLSRDERLVGPALLCLKYGRIPYAYAKAIAAAYDYNGSDDAGTREVQGTVKKEGIEKAVKRFSSIDETSKLYHLIIESYKSKSFIF
jgi:mannitol-1-phosphate 5-dehydrogenase